jgi:hypothetical protein
VHTQESQEGGEIMMKFYIVKKNERDGETYPSIMEFENHHDLETFLAYNRNYIKEMQTLDETDKYLFEDVQGNRVQG